jgi:hypothetical protein
MPKAEEARKPRPKPKPYQLSKKIRDEESPYAFNGVGDTDLQIVLAVRDEMKENSEVIEVDDSDNEDVDAGINTQLCKQLEWLSIKFGCLHFPRLTKATSEFFFSCTLTS